MTDELRALRIIDKLRTQVENPVCIGCGAGSYAEHKNEAWRYAGNHQYTTISLTEVEARRLVACFDRLFDQRSVLS